MVIHLNARSALEVSGRGGADCETLVANSLYLWLGELTTSKDLDAIVENPVERIRISQEWNIRPDWIFEGFLELCQREKHITAEEMEYIVEELAPTRSFDLLHRILVARDLVQDHKFQGCPAGDFPVLVSEAMGLPLSDYRKPLNPAQASRESGIPNCNGPTYK